MKRETEAAVLVKPGEPLRLMRLSIPELKPGQVLVEVAYSGVCRSQLLEVRGRRGHDPYLPHTLGHEGSGRVLETGAGVTKVRPGDRVILSWIKGHGADVPAATYAGPQGQVNSGAVSTFARHSVASENRVTPVPDGMALREAALLGCAVPTGAGTIFNTARVKEGDRVAVFGAGGIGLSAVMAAAAAKASVIVAVDVRDEALARARELGATHLVHAGRENPVEVIRCVTGGGVDCAVECAGRRESMEAAFKAVKNGGGLCVLAGNLPSGECISIDPFDLIRGRRIVGTWGGETDPDRDIPLYAAMFLEGRLPLSRLIAREFALEEINLALDELDAGVLGRGLVDLSLARPSGPGCASA
ncbi:MAG: zinc-binding dehydrogenase [Planctomycetes bacterium]|nr:zinc-binding dehydrogenase [Planctomycetota bacterium]